MDFPEEILELIFFKTSLFDRFCRLSLVCKPWRKVALANLGPEIDLTLPFPDPIPRLNFRGIYLPSTKKYDYTQININKVFVNRDYATPPLYAHLTLEARRKVETLKFDGDHPAMSLSSFNSENLIISPFNNLTELEINNAGSLPIKVPLASFVPRLRSLTLVETNFMRFPTLKEFHFFKDKDFMGKLAEFRLISLSPYFKDYEFYFPDSAFLSFSNLRRLSLTDRCLPLEAKNVLEPTLEELSIGIISQMDIEVLAQFHFPKLTRLTVTSFHRNSGVLPLEAFAPKLESLTSKFNPEWLGARDNIAFLGLNLYALSIERALFVRDWLIAVLNGASMLEDLTLKLCDKYDTPEFTNELFEAIKKLGTLLKRLVLLDKVEVLTNNYLSDLKGFPNLNSLQIGTF